MIGEQIRAARRMAGMSLRDLAPHVGVSHTMLTRYEGGHTTPGSDKLLKIAQACGVRVEFFFREPSIGSLKIVSGCKDGKCLELV